jgi:hypothetical protein
MTFFERYLSVAPDGGSGATEAVCVAAVLFIVLAIGFRGKLYRLFREMFLSA